MRASLESLSKRLTPAISPTSLAAVRTPQPGSASSRGAICATSVASSRSSSLIARVSSRMRRSSSRAILTRVDCSARARRPAMRSCQQIALRARAGSSSSGHVVEVPAQVVAQAGSLCDETLAVIDEQPNVELGPRELRDRKRVDSFADRGPGDRDGVDRVGLAALARRDARSGGQLWRDAHDPLAAGKQEPLERARDVPAVLDRPNALHVQAPAPEQQSHRRSGVSPRPSARRSHGRFLPRGPPRCASACGCPSRSRSSAPSLLVGDLQRTDVRWTHLSRGDASLLSGHTGDPQAAAGDTTSAGQTTGRQKINESARRQPEDLPVAPDATARPPDSRTEKIKGSAAGFGRILRGVWVIGSVAGACRRVLDRAAVARRVGGRVNRELAAPFSGALVCAGGLSAVGAGRLVAVGCWVGARR